MAYGRFTEYLWNSKRVLIRATIRVQHANKAWGWYNRYSGCVIDDAGRVLGSFNCPAGEFNRTARPTGRQFFINHGDYQLDKEN